MANEKEKPYIHNNDFVIDDEITVRITIAEYRELVSFKAKHEAELSKLKSEKFKVEQENKRLKDKILSLTTECEDGDKVEEEW